MAGNINDILASVAWDMIDVDACREEKTRLIQQHAVAGKEMRRLERVEGIVGAKFKKDAAGTLVLDRDTATVEARRHFSQIAARMQDLDRTIQYVEMFTPRNGETQREAVWRVLSKTH